MKRFIFEKENLAPISNFQKSGNNFAVSRLEFRVCLLKHSGHDIRSSDCKGEKRGKFSKKQRHGGINGSASAAALIAARPPASALIVPDSVPTCSNYRIQFFKFFSLNVLTPFDVLGIYQFKKKKIVWKILKFCY